MSAPQTPAEAIRQALPESVSWPARPTDDDLKVLPGCPAVYLFVDDSGQPVQLLTSQQLKRTASARLSEPDAERRGQTDLAAVVRGVRWRPVFSRFEARWRYYQLARVLHPREYRKLVSFGPAWFLHVDWTRGAPELRVSERVWRLDGEFVGPWPTHKSCQEALDGLWDLFDLCRYPEQVRKAPGGARCAYADMGRCDAPCDGSTPLDAYVTRTRSAWRFAIGEIHEWIEEAEQRMRSAAGAQQFERAGLLKNQIEFARMWQRRWSKSVRPADDLNYLLIVPATRRKAWKLFLFRRGDLVDGPLVSDRKLTATVPHWLAEQLKQPRPPLDADVCMEQAWLVAHFLQHKESAAALVVRISDEVAPSDLGDQLDATLEARSTRHDRESTLGGSVDRPGGTM